MIKKILLLTMFTILITLNFSKAEASPTGVISIEPILKDDQPGGVKSYFNIEVDTEGYKDTLEFAVRNKSKKTLTVKIFPVNSLTSTTGVIDYRGDVLTDHSKLIKEDHAFTNYAKVLQDEIVLEAGQTKRIGMEVDIPKFNGTVLGGLAIRVLADTETSTEGKSQFEIKHEVTNVIATMITNNKTIEHGLEFGEVFLRPSPSYYNIVLPSTLNSEVLIASSDLEYTVRDSKGKVLFKAPENSRFNFAPNSEVNVNFPWTANEMVDGEEYTIKGSFTYNYYGNKIVAPFEKKFKYDKGLTNDAGSFVKPDITKEGFNWKLLYLLIIPALLLLLLPFMLNKRYVLYSDVEEYDEEISEEDGLYEWVKVFVKRNISKDGQGYKYAHIYKKKKRKKEKYYSYVETMIVPKDKK